MNPMDSKRLTEERAGVVAQIAELTGVIQREARAFTADEMNRFDELEKQAQQIDQQLETVRRLERSANLGAVSATEARAVTSYAPKATITRADRSAAFKAWSLHQAGQSRLITRAMGQAAEKCGVALDRSDYVLHLGDSYDVVRNQSVGTAAEGGELTNDSLFQGLERNLKFFGGARQFARVIRTETGETYHFAYSDDTSNVASIQSGGENNTVTNTSITYSRKSVSAWTFVTGVYPVSVQLLQDARYDVASDVGGALGVRLARGTAAKYSLGAGTTEPSGYITDASAGETTASPTAITYGELVDFYHSIDVAYRSDPSFGFVMHDSTLAYLHKIVDSNGRPLFWNYASDLSNGTRFNLFGHPIFLDNSLATIAATHTVIAAGAWDKFLIRDAADVQIIALRERFMDTLSVGYLAYMRTDCKLLNPNAVKTLVMHA